LHCKECHDNVTKLQSLPNINATVAGELYVNYTAFNESGHATGTIDWHPGETFYKMDCWDCHEEHTVALIHCTDCHHNVTYMEGLSPTINETVAEELCQNTTAYNASAHAQKNVTCLYCHAKHESVYQQCVDCHTGAGQYDADIIYRHQPSGGVSLLPRGTTTFGTSTTANCTECHNNSVDKYSPYHKQTSYVSHYLKYPPINSSDCKSCHDDVVNGTKWGNAQQVNKSGAVPCEYCHNYDKTSLPSTFHNQTMGIYWVCSDVECHPTRPKTKSYP